MRILRTKICLIFTVLALLIPLCVLPASLEQNAYFPDGDFETALSSAWKVTGTGERCKDCKNSGAYGFRLRDGRLSRRVYLYNDEIYTLTFYYKLAVSATFSVSVNYFDDGNRATVVNDSAKTYSYVSDGWTAETMEIRPGAADDAVVISFAASGEIYLDDISFEGPGKITGELMQNGGGEVLKSDGTTLAHWAMPDHGTLSRTTEEVYSGSYAIKLDNTKTGVTRIVTSQTVYICPEREYLFSLYVRTPGVAYANVDIAFYDEEGKGVGTTVSISLGGTGQADWKKRERPFATPEGAIKAKISIFVGGSGAVLFDDISLYGEVPSAGTGRDAIYAKDVKPPHKETGELLTNTSFETTLDGKPTGWTSSYQSQYVTSAEEKVYSGAKSLRLSDAKGSVNPWAVQEVYDIVPDAEYQFRAWVYADCDLSSADGVGIKVEFYTSDGKNEGQYSARCHVDTMDGWQEALYRFETPSSCTRIRLYLRMYGIGTAYMDDVSLTRTSGVRRPVLLTTDSAVYYTDDGQGEAILTVNPRAVAFENITFAEGASVRFLISDGETNLYTKEASLCGDMAACSFPIALLEEQKKPYTVTASVGDSDGTVYTESLTVHVYERPGALRKDGTYIVDGEPFVPVMAYHIGNAAENNAKYLPFCVSAGINVVQTQLTTSAQDLKNQLDMIASYGLKALVTVYPNMKPAAHPDNAETVRALVEVAQNHKATFAYALIDEPSGAIPAANGERDRLLRESHALVREGDSHHPTFIVDMSFMEDIARYPDVFTIDAYNTAQYGANTKNVIAATNGKKPIYVLLPTYQKTLPPIGEIKYAAYDAMMAGAKGIGFYAVIGEGGNPDLPDRPLGDDLIAWHLSGERDVATNRFVHGKYKTEGKGETESICWETFWDKDTLYAVVLNKDDAPCAVEIPLEGNIRDIAFLTDMSGNIGATMSDAVLSAELPKRSACVFEITSGEGKSNAYFTDADGKTVRNLVPGQTVTVHYRHVAQNAEEKISFCVALYQKEDGREKLLSLQMKEDAVAYGTPYEHSEEITVPPLGTGTYAIKAFIWEKGKGPKPFGKAYVLQ